MSVLPLVVVWGLLAGAAPLLAILRRPRPLTALAVAVPVLAWPLWLLARPDAPAAVLGGRWATGATPWQLTGIVLLLLLVAVAATLIHRTPDTLPARRLAESFALAAATLPALWAGDARLRVVTTALFAVTWTAIALAESGGSTEARRAALGLAAAVALRWAAVIPGTVGAMAGIGGAAILLGLRPGAKDESLLLRGLPVVVGASALAATLGEAAITPPLLALVTAAGLLALLLGLSRVAIGPAVGRALGPALAGVALLAGVWAGEAALLPAARLAVFVPALLAFVPAIGFRPGRLAAWGVAYVALAGLPLTVGIAALARLYGAWVAAGGYVLLAIIALLLALWLAAVVLSGRAAESGAPRGRLGLEVLPAALTLPGLLQWDAAILSTPVLVWVALLLPAVAGAALGRFVPSLGDWADALRHALAPALPPSLASRIGRLREAAAAAVADAIGLLEGENGLLFLLALVLLLLWIGR